MVTRDELLGEAEWEVEAALASGGLPALRVALRKLEWLDPFHARLRELRREIEELDGRGHDLHPSRAG